MANTIEIVERARNVKNRVLQVSDYLPTTNNNVGSSYEQMVLHAGAETLQLIDRISSGEKLQLNKLTDQDSSLRTYIQALVEREKGDATAAGQYVLITVNSQRFLGIARLVKRELSIAELRNVYSIDRSYGDDLIKAAKANAQFPLITDAGIQVSFSAMPLQAIQDVNQAGSRDAKLAAHATATNILTSAESSQVVQNGLEDDCHDESPELTAANIHYITPIAIALSAATEQGQLDSILRATSLTTALTHGNLNPSLAQTLHMHEVPTNMARKQTSAVAETGLFGGVKNFDLIYWLQGWNSKVDGVDQAELRRLFTVYEIDPENTFALASNLHDLSATNKLELSVLSGAALSTSPEKLEKQVLKLSDRNNLFQPMRNVFTS